MPTTKTKKTYTNHASQQSRDIRIGGALPGGKVTDQATANAIHCRCNTAIDLVVVKVEQKPIKQGLSRAK